MFETKVNLDAEWMKLIVEAKNLGIGKEEIREFFMKNKPKDTTT